MAISSEYSESEMMTDINMTPLIDVMLVLLIIFIVTLPVMSHALKVDLPKATSQPVQTTVKDIDVSIKADGSIAWNKVEMSDGPLQAQLHEASLQEPQPALRIFADQHVEYGKVAKLLADAQNAGLTQMDFVTEQPATGN